MPLWEQIFNLSCLLVRIKVLPKCSGIIYCISKMILESKELYQPDIVQNPSAIQLKTFRDLMKLSLKNPVNWNNHGFHIFHFSELLRHRKKKRERYREERKKDFILGILRARICHKACHHNSAGFCLPRGTLKGSIP